MRDSEIHKARHEVLYVFVLFSSLLALHKSTEIPPITAQNHKHQAILESFIEICSFLVICGGCKNLLM